MDRPAEIEIGIIPDASFVSSVLVKSTIVKGSLGLNTECKFHSSENVSYDYLYQFYQADYKFNQLVWSYDT